MQVIGTKIHITVSILISFNIMQVLELVTANSLMKTPPLSKTVVKWKSVSSRLIEVIQPTISLTLRERASEANYAIVC